SSDLRACSRRPSTSFSHDRWFQLAPVWSSKQVTYRCSPDVRRFRVFLLPSKRRNSMRQHWLVVLLAVIAVGLVGGTAVERAVAGQSSRGNSFTPFFGAIGSLDPTGPYEVVQGWPKDLSTLPGNEKWTFGAGQGVFAE